MQPLSHLTFGVEFEVILPPTLSHARAVARLSSISGLPVVIGQRTALTRADSPDWRVVHDGSVSGNGIAAEFVSPVLKGQDGIDQVAKFAQALTEIGATANATCGFHVHVGSFRASVDFFKTLVKLYARYESALDSIMPRSRRANYANYCRSLARVNPAEIDRASTIDQIIYSATGIPAHDYSGRFFKLNFHSYRKHKTVEFRQHSGTVDSDKAVNWIKTCLRLVVAAEKGKTGTTPSAPVSFLGLPVKTRKVAEFVTRPEGATREEIISGTDWSALSVNRQARLAGLEIRVIRERGKDRFFAVVGAQVLVSTDLAGLASLIESADDESAYLNERARFFAANS